MIKLLMDETMIPNKKVVVYNYKDTDVEMTDEEIAAIKIDPVHYLFLVDRSGSMYSDLAGLVEDIKSSIKQLDDKDLISIIYFASHNRCKVLLQGANKNTPNLDLLIDSLNSTLGLTCFSEPLKLTNDVIDDLLVLCKNTVVTLHTDGCAVTPWSTSEEHSRSIEQVKRMKGKLLMFNAIGYGYYYDESFLKSLVETAGVGSFYHSEKIEDFSRILGTTALIAKEYEKGSLVVDTHGEAMYLTLKSVNYFADGKINLDFMSKYRNQIVAIVPIDQTSISINGEDVLLENTGVINTKTKNNILYALASSYSLINDFERALDIMVILRDKYFIDRILNVFTKSERAMLVDEIKLAYKYNNNRFREGEAPEGYLPPEDVFNIFDMFNYFETTGTMYVPGAYERIGMKVTESLSLFKKSDEQTLASFEDLVFSEDKLNVSVRFKNKGTVKLIAKRADSVGLPREVESCTYRVHTFVKDGNIHMKEFKVKVADVNTFKLFCMNSNILITAEEGDILTIDISNVPITNRKNAKESNLVSILNLVKDATIHKARAKYIKWLLNDLRKVTLNEDLAFNGYTEEQFAVLTEHGISRDGVYAGNGNEKAEITDDTDFYMARTLSFGIKGWSSIPTIKPVLEKYAEGKKVTGISTIIIDEHVIWTNKLVNTSVDDVIIELQKELSNCNTISRKSMAEVAKLKISKVVAGLWFNELGEITEDSKNENFEHEGTTLVIKTSNTKVYFSN